MKLTSYHNPRCRKSREALQYLQQKAYPLEVINYFEAPLSESQLTGLLKQLDFQPKTLVRTAEALWKTDFKGKELSDEQIIRAMCEHPKSMERPIISNGSTAVVARPIDKLIDFLK